MPDVNGMQANIGLSGIYADPQGIATPTPAETSLRLSMESAQRAQESLQIMSKTPLGVPQAFQRQFQQQMQSIQAQQSMNPYSARALAQRQPTGDNQYLPSPITMTPPSSGVFRPPAPKPSMAPIAPTYTPSWGSSMAEPFTPQAPTPMFGSSYDQQIRQGDIRANRTYSNLSQAPRAIGTGMGIMAGAGIGAAAGSVLGPLGTLAGAGVGALAAGMSGVAQGVGNVAQGFMRPSIQRHEMGAGLQNMSQNWVSTGSDVSKLGRGMSRNSSLELAGEIQDMAGSSAFQKQTGNMFNSQDLMQITRKGGESGLFDMSQNVPQIKEKLKETAGTIKQFMELTNDPSVTSVIRQMGRLQQFGMSQKDMVTAAQGMRSYARAAGTSVEGLQQIGGLPGAATFQGVGLTAGQGFQYGNMAAASANQMVSSGSISSRQLALQGGVQGMAQRDVQAQAAFSSMPLFAASQAQYSGGEWGADPNKVGRGQGGAFGMVHGAMQSMNQAVQKGGIGALATFQMKQREVADEALSQMTPMEQMAQRFKTAMGTGRQLGLSGREALSVGGTTAFGAESANQMDLQASSPKFWETKRQAIRQRQMELGLKTQQRHRDEAPMLGFDVSDKLGLTGAGSWGRKTSGAFGDFGESFSAVGGAISDVAGKGWDELIMGGSDTITSKFDTGVSGIKAAARRKDTSAFTRQAGRLGARAGRGSAIEIDQDLQLQAAKADRQTGVGAGEAIGNALSIALPVGKWGTMGSGIAQDIITPEDTQQQMARRELTESSDLLDRFERAKTEGGNDKKFKQAYSSVEKAMGKKGEGMGVDVVRRAANKLDKRVQGDTEEANKAGWAGAEAGSLFGPMGAAAGWAIGKMFGAGGDNVRIKDSEYDDMAIEAMMESSEAKGTSMTKKEATAKYNAMSPEDKENLKTQFTAEGKEGSKNKDAYDNMEGGMRKNRADQLTDAANQRVDDLKDDDYRRIEDDLDLDSVFGMTLDDDKKTQAMAAKYGDKFGAMAAQAALDSGVGDEEQLSKELAKLKLGSKEQASMKKKLKGMTEEDRERLKDIGASGVSVSDINSYGATSFDAESQTAFGSQGFTGAFGKYSKTLEGHLGTKEGPVSGQSIAKQFTKEERVKMAKYGGEEGRLMAKLTAQAGYEGTDEGKQKKAQEAGGLITRIAAEKAEQDKKGKEEQAKVKAEGPEAKSLEKDMKAIDEMAAMFADFKPAIKEFEKGTRNLSEAMESDAMSRMLKEDD